MKALKNKTDASLLGPLAPLVGIWEGAIGQDIAPSDDRGIEQNAFREKISFEEIAPTRNHEQILYGLRYFTTAWPKASQTAFHEETGYWLWDPSAKQVLRCTTIPRGLTFIAGGTAERDAKVIEITSQSGTDTYGICSNLFLDKEFKTIRFTMRLTIVDETHLSYEQTTFLKIKGRSTIFEHTDKNSLVKIG